MNGGFVAQFPLLAMLMACGLMQISICWLRLPCRVDSSSLIVGGTVPGEASDAQSQSSAMPESEAQTNQPFEGGLVGSEGDRPRARRISTQAAITAIAVTPDGKYCVTGSQAGLHVYVTSSMQHVCQVATQLQAIHDLKFTADGSWLAVAGGTPGQFGMLELYSWNHRQLLQDHRQLLRNHSQQPIWISLLANARLHSDVIYAVDWCAAAQPLQPSQGAPPSSLQGHSLSGRPVGHDQADSSAELPPAALWLATASLDGISCVFQLPGAASNELDSPTVAAVFSDPPLASVSGHSRGVTGVLFVGSGADVSLVTASLDQTLRVWSLPDGKLQRTLNNHTAPVTGLVQPRPQKSNTLPLIASYSDDKTLRFWQPTIGRMVSFHRFTTAPTGVAWLASRDQLIIGCQDGAIHQMTRSTLSITSASAEFRDRLHVVTADPQERFCLAGSRAGIASLPLPATFDASGSPGLLDDPE